MMRIIALSLWLVTSTVIHCTYSQKVLFTCVLLCENHTMCIYVKPIDFTRCENYFSGGVNSTDIGIILNIHNTLRSKVALGMETQGIGGPQPPAANMRKMIWDVELAAIAQRWAGQCILGHDECRDVPRFYVGQNYYRAGSTVYDPTYREDWQTVIQSWYNEVALFNKLNIAPFKFDSPPGHYTQIVWANTWAIGCGFSYYKSDSNRFYRKSYICNYGPAGSVVGAGTAMYMIGKAGSKCPRDTVKDSSSGLCA